MAHRTRPGTSARGSHLKATIALGIILVAGLVVGLQLWCFYCCLCAGSYRLAALDVGIELVQGGTSAGVFVLLAVVGVLAECYLAARRLAAASGRSVWEGLFLASVAYLPLLALLPDTFYYVHVWKWLPYVALFAFPLVMGLVVALRRLCLPGGGGKEDGGGSSTRSIVVLLVLMCGYACYFSWLTIRRYHCLNIGYSDAGLFWEIVKHSAQGKPFFSNHYLFIPPRVAQQTFLALHVQPILLLLVPFYWLSSGLETLFVVQAAVIASGAAAVYMLAKDELENPNLALILAGAYLLYPPLQNLHLNYYYGFHPVSLAIPFLLFAFVFLRRGNRWAFALFTLLALCCKENVGLVVFMLGIYAFFFLKDRRLGVVTAVVGLVWSVVCAQAIIPYFRGEAYPFWNTLYPKLPEQLTYPWRLFAQVLFRRKLVFLLELLVPVGLLSLLSPSTLMLVVFPLGISLLVKNQTPGEGEGWAFYSSLFHYHSLIIPGIFISAVMGMKRVLSWQAELEGLWRRIKVPLQLQKGALGAATGGLVLTVSLLCTFFLGSLPISATFVPTLMVTGDRTPHIAEVEKMIPAEASLVATDFVAAHFLDRDRMRVLPPGEVQIDDDYILLDRNDRRLQLDFSGESRRWLEALISLLVDRRDYEKRFEHEGLVLFARVETTALKNTERASSPAPD